MHFCLIDVMSFSNTALHTILAWAHTEHCNFWKSTVGCRQAKMFLQGPDRQLACFAMGLSRKHLCILTGLPVLTGQVVLNRHLTVMKISTDPMYHNVANKKPHIIS